MKSFFNIVLTFFISLFSFSTTAQNKTGEWYGTLDAMGRKIPIGANINQLNGKYFGELTSPGKKGAEINFDTISIIENHIYFEIKKLKIRYIGVFAKNKIIGKFTQGMVFDLEFTREKLKVSKPKRPQTPKPPFNYYTKEITINNTIDNVSLSGTLTLPTNDGKKYPVVILISGSGPQNRDSEIFGHKSFWVIADYFAKNGIGTFRYDERGVGKSTGKHSECDLDDLYRDVQFITSKIRKTKGVKKVGLLGHSEGGIIAPWYASNCSKVKFVIMLAAPGVKPIEMMHDQRRLQSELMGVQPLAIKINETMFRKIDSAVLSSINDSLLKIKLRKITDETLSYLPNPKEQQENLANQLIPFVTKKWYKSFISINPADYLSKIRKPVLVIGGGKDRQVPMKPNIKAIAKALGNGKCKDWQIIKKGNLNHLFQKCEIGSVQEYSELEETFSEDVLKDMVEWILEM